MSVSSLEIPQSPANSGSIRDLRRTGIHPDHWYPLLRARKLKPGKVIGVTFAGAPIVLVRTESGRAFALEDRCAHRQVPLSAGVVEGEQIKCCYHGWTYDCAGRCVNIPYIGKSESAPRGVRVFPCREEYGFIWVFPGDAAKATGASFPSVPAWHDPAYKTRYLDHEVGCHYSFLHENLMDMNHQFLHRRLMAQIKTGFLDLREGENWVEVDYTFSRVGKQPVGE
jgi:phenylpropionate dioxygenase-like ring-hydroxylating dioxygenase large terminal subunit